MELAVLLALGIGGYFIWKNASPSTPPVSAPTIESGGADPVSMIVLAIASAEGYGIPGKIPTEANNPLDLVVGDIGYGTMGAQKITVFPTAQDGFNAGYAQVLKMVNGTSGYYNPSMTWTQIGAKYAGAGTPWAANVARALRVDPNSTLGDFLAA
jgi:hypothetical protein